MSTEITVPQLGESIVEATVGRWQKNEGDAVTAGEPLVELETDKVNVEVSAPGDGVLSSIVKHEGETVGVGEVLAQVSAEQEQAQPASREWIAVARVEQLYPYPEEAIATTLRRYPHLAEVVWLQEEPRNMGAWSYIAPQLELPLSDGVALRYVGRPERASTAEGLPNAHAAEQARIIGEALGGERPAGVETREGQYVN